jgi:hypothetical protein
MLETLLLLRVVVVLVDALVLLALAAYMVEVLVAAVIQAVEVLFVSSIPVTLAHSHQLVQGTYK